MLRTKFLKLIEEIAECEFDKAVEEIHNNFESSVCELWDSLFEKFQDILMLYQSHEEHNMCGELEYIYISYLRSSILKGDPYYRIDFYDDNDRYRFHKEASVLFPLILEYGFQKRLNGLS